MNGLPYMYIHVHVAVSTLAGMYLFMMKRGFSWAGSTPHTCLTFMVCSWIFLFQVARRSFT